jgi:hypothetical protein
MPNQRRSSPADMCIVPYCDAEHVWTYSDTRPDRSDRQKPLVRQAELDLACDCAVARVVHDIGPGSSPGPISVPRSYRHNRHVAHTRYFAAFSTATRHIGPASMARAGACRLWGRSMTTDVLSYRQYAADCLRQAQEEVTQTAGRSC